MSSAIKSLRTARNNTLTLHFVKSSNCATMQKQFVNYCNSSFKMHAGSKLVVSTHDPDTLSHGTYAGGNRFRSGPHRVQMTFLSLLPVIS